MEYYDLLEKYMNGKLNKDEVAKFKKIIINNEEMKKEYYLMKDVDNFLSNYDDENFENKLKNIIREESRPTIIYKKPQLGTIIKFAASIILLVSIASFVYYFVIQDKSTRMYNQFYQPYEYSAVTRTNDNTELNNEFKSALEEYNSRNYRQAIQYFEQVLKEDSQYFIASLLIAICHIEIEETSQARVILSEIVNKNNYLINETANWYLALCYVKENDFNNARLILEDLTSYKNYYQLNAQKLLNKID